jgi:hypothetical protein
MEFPRRLPSVIDEIWTLVDEVPAALANASLKIFCLFPSNSAFVYGILTLRTRLGGAGGEDAAAWPEDELLGGGGGGEDELLGVAGGEDELLGAWLGGGGLTVVQAVAWQDEVVTGALPEQ